GRGTTLPCFPYTTLFRSDVASIEERMARLARGQRGLLRVGFTSSAAAHAFIPDAIRACRARFPDIELVLSEDNAATLTEAVAASDRKSTRLNSSHVKNSY